MNWYENQADEYVKKLQQDNVSLTWELIKKTYIKGMDLRAKKYYQEHKEQVKNKSKKYYEENKNQINKKRKIKKGAAAKYLLIKDSEEKKFSSYQEIADFLGCSTFKARKIVLENDSLNGWEGDLLI